MISDMLLGKTSSVAFVGHKEERFTKKSFLDKCVKDAIHILQVQSEGECLVLINGARGISNRVYEAATERRMKFKIFLPYSLDIYREMKDDDQADKIEKQISDRLCSGMYVANTYYDEDDLMARNEKMIDEATFVVVFWLGRRIGETFECINYALKCGKIVYNAYGEYDAHGKGITQLQLEDIQ